MAQGDQRFAVTETFMGGDVPLRCNRSQDAKSLRRVRPRHVRQMAEGALVGEAFGGVMGGQRYGLK